MINKAYCQNLLKEYLPKDGPLSQEIEYCLNSGGKRMRMILCLQIAQKLDVLCDNVKRIAVAIELVHNYSLVHDDLPCMDNDDERRGMPTCHKKYGQASAVLTGDALLNLAMEVALSGDFDQLGYADAVRNLFSSTGTSGMIGGQVFDLFQKAHNMQQYVDITLKKTGALISASVFAPLYLAQSSPQDFELWNVIANNFSILFQLADDLKDSEKDENSALNFSSKEAVQKTIDDLSYAIDTLLPFDVSIIDEIISKVKKQPKQ